MTVLEVRIYPMSPDFWREQPAAAGAIVTERVARRPDVVHVVLIGSRADTTAFVERELVGRNTQSDLKVWPDAHEPGSPGG